MQDDSTSRLDTTKEEKHYAIVAEDKEPDLRTIKAYVDDFLWFAEGDLEATEDTIQVQSKDLAGGGGSSEVEVKNWIEAEWKGFDTNRQDPPDVVKGEQVILSRSGVGSPWYWESAGRDDELRLTEHMIISISSKPDVSTAKDGESTYFLELDSRKDKRKINLRTSKKNEEKVKYSLLFDVDNEVMKLCDDKNNEITINSAENDLLIRNGDGTVMNLNKTNMSISVPESLFIKTGTQIVLDTKMLTANVATVMMLNCGHGSINANNSFTIAASNIGLNGVVAVPNSLWCRDMHAWSYDHGGVGKALG